MPRVRIYAIVLVIIAIVAAGMTWYYKQDKRLAPAKNTNSEQKSSTPPAAGEPTSLVQTGEQESQTMEGILKKSDNAKRGNYMLVMKDRTVYISTNRDFLGLLNKTVIVAYEGTLDDFTLGDITEKK